MQSAENVLIIEEKLDICKLMAVDRVYTEEYYRSRRSTIVAIFSKTMDNIGMKKKSLKISEAEAK